VRLLRVETGECRVRQRSCTSELGHDFWACAPSRMPPDKSSVVLDRESDQEMSLDPSGPRIRLHALRLVAPQGRSLVL
jgi:hypothetical protein